MKKVNQFTAPWTDEQLKILSDMHYQGKTDEEIGTILGRSARAISLKRSRNRLVSEDPHKEFKDKDWLYQKYHIEGLSTTDIAEIAGVNHTTVGKWMENCGIERRDFQERTDRHKAKIGAANKLYTGANHHCWKGGRTKTNEGYVCIRKPDHPFTNAAGNVLEHRLVMEKHIGRYLKSEEVIHHINEIKDDNRIENLHLFATSADHTYFHVMERNGRKVELQYEYKQNGITRKAN